MASAKQLGYQPQPKKSSPIQDAIRRRMKKKQEEQPTSNAPEAPDYKNVEPDEVKKRKQAGY